MADDWIETDLGSVATLQRGFDLPTQERSDGRVPIVSSSGITGTHSVAMVLGPGVVTGRYGTIGQVFYIERDYWPLNTTLFVRDFKGNDPRFVFYLLKSIDFLSCSDKSSVPGVNRNDLHQLIVRVPVSLSEQQAIAQILGALDDKIELNRRMNETLEAMARAIFKSWFVDFDPVRAKLALSKAEGAEGRKPFGMDAATAALFPDSFQDSPLGKIPKGWKVLPISAVIERLSVGKKYDQKTVKPTGRVPVLDQGKSGLIGYHDDEPGVLASENFPVAVFANHTCYMRLVTFPFSTIQNVLPFLGNGVDTTWAFYATCGKQSFTEYKGHWPDFIIHEIVVPDRSLTVEFSKMVGPFLRRSRANEGESQTLAGIRDALLPKLISGEIRVKDAEKCLAKL